MIKVRVQCSKSYDVLIERGSLSGAAQLITQSFGSKKLCIVTDDNVQPLYLDKLLGSLKESGAQVCSFVFAHGEENKTMQTVERIMTFLSENHFSRSDMLIALGGGIVGDVTGFAAAVYQRGIEFIQIPTTLLAAVDSSVGGKTGVNLGGLKNQVGAFWQPAMVICDPLTFDTLGEVELSSGMAEVIKYAAICRKDLAQELENGTDIEQIIAECVSIKRDIVQADERDNGKRQLLNLGHTFGHAVEKATSHAFTHGQAVAIGMVMAFNAAQKLGYCAKGEIDVLKRLCDRYGLPTTCSATHEQLLCAMQSDKKRSGGTITLILPKAFGDSRLYEIEMSSLGDILEKGMD